MIYGFGFADFVKNANMFFFANFYFEYIIYLIMRSRSKRNYLFIVTQKNYKSIHKFIYPSTEMNWIKTTFMVA